MDGPADKLIKGDAIVAYAQTLAIVEKARRRGDDETAAVECEDGLGIVKGAAFDLGDDDLDDIATLLSIYCQD